MAVKEGGKVKLDKVLQIADGENVTTGKKNGKGDKIIVFKYKSKVRYRRKKGHRQLLTSLNIDKILPPGVEEEKPVKRTRRKKTEVKKDGA